jgi:hypothetical protein
VLECCELIHIDKDTKQHDTFFVGHWAVISSQDVLSILIREFMAETSDDVIRMK